MQLQQPEKPPAVVLAGERGWAKDFHIFLFQFDSWLIFFGVQCKTSVFARCKPPTMSRHLFTISGPVVPSVHPKASEVRGRSVPIGWVSRIADAFQIVL